jgi:hypothetical protein
LTVCAHLFSNTGERAAEIVGAAFAETLGSEPTQTLSVVIRRQSAS